MEAHLHTPTQSAQVGTATSHRLTHDLEQQCLRVLRCTARALANSPGGLRFRAGTQPWLDALHLSSGDLSLSAQQGA
ncbi:MAG: hypothetical protein WCH60_02410 [Burkholderiales bacterium]